ncbi:hypothetical protein QQY66_49225 [Streptomyces sp. DG2A-72]|uniref:hypothetical protein n=1 Tax=Streptomyces sp. DG2A-72 TaxID=3051386 RepID=UPI00265B8522|nr:hypothetical protein [Streptomyces sp. DG2A-72]MDO0939297.1 hypothetical protein [Streptomyces sp. DG2A-72]
MVNIQGHEQRQRNVPQLIAQPTAFPVGGAMMAAVVLSPYGGAGRAEIERFPAYASLTPLDQEAPADGGPWHFWQDPTGPVLLALNKPGAEGEVHVVMELADPPPLWWNLARQRAQMAVVWLSDVRHPTTDEMKAALKSRSGWMASARWIEPVALL